MTFIKWQCDLGHQSNFRVRMETFPIPQDYKIGQKNKSSTGSVLAQNSTVEYFCVLLIKLKAIQRTDVPRLLPAQLQPQQGRHSLDPCSRPMRVTAALLGWVEKAPPGSEMSRSASPSLGEVGGCVSHPEKQM